ncbi:putative disease resistance RPP13-like protein 1 [Capsicum annuum]|uniref:putative disease resistance RPP13-like protein 1 n=1 Tax=Capsicum annuum TaxID=4072 RepID=UPI001FB16DD3|nr:putative disease resistance RPP13-like protein 1 [Capsicum annuum]
MDIGLAVGGAFLSSASNVLFDRLDPHGDLLKMFQKHKLDVGLLEKLEDILLGLQIVLSDAENKKASNPLVRKWMNKLQRAVDGAENFLEEVNYEALRLKVESQHPNLAETSNQQKYFYSDKKLEIRTLSTSLVDESEIFGREIEIERLIDRLLSNDANGKNMIVVPIVGMGGVGKTTLAKAVYNDKEDALRITKGLLQEIGSFNLKVDDNLNQLQVKLKERLMEKSFSLFWMMCGMTTTTKVEGWRRILRSEIWDLSNNDILPTLMLSYNELPPHLKPCFSYCAIFPKDYPFRKEQVIHLWIANGLVVPRRDEGNKDLGNQYFNELRSRSLFKRVSEFSERDGGKFLMHDLVNDLAQIASSKLCVRLEECKESHMLNQSCHMSYSMGKGVDFEKLTPVNKLEKLRTLIPELPDALFIKVKLLRLLDLSRTDITKLPDSIYALYNLETLLLSSCTYLELLLAQMEKLINLRLLDIRNTSCLKTPLHLRKLKSLQVLVGAEFLLGGPCGWRKEDLSEAHYLYGSLSILELQNVVDRREAPKANMREKNHVEKLSLEWSESDADNSQTERDILDELRPHTNIKELQICRYRRTRLPNWLADHLFLNLLVQLSLINCKDCFSLPALGQLPSLKFLSIRDMHQITEVTEEFCGSSSYKKSFNSLEKLEFAEMPKWKQWHVLGNGEFPTLQNLSIEDCPKLIGKFPENLCSLTKLRISRCPKLNLETPIQLSSLKKFEVDGSLKAGVVFDEAELFTSQLQGMKQIEELSIGNCNSLTSLPTSTLPSTLKTITICCCRKLKLDTSVGDRLTLTSCELVPRKCYLYVNSFPNLTRFFTPNGTERLDISCCENLELLSVAWGTQITSLFIYECEKLKRLPQRMQELLPSLKGLQLWNFPEIESFPDGGLPFNLQLLVIDDCKKLVNGRKEWHLQRLPSLRELYIIHDSDEEIVGGENWELPCSIRRLTIDNLTTFSSQALKSLTSLEYLRTCSLPQIQSLLEQGLPSSLSKLYLSDHDELHSLPTEALGHLTSLQSLEISNCHQLQSLPESELPSSLSKLTIYNCPNL